ncbi:MAG: ATP-binding protein, partial [Planctomycetota bacterium]
MTDVSNTTTDATRSRRRWLSIYFVLAVFDLATICFSLYLNHELAEVYGQSVRDNLQWATRSAELSELTQAAFAVSAPGNDVFDSHDVNAEQLRFESALRDFEEHVAAIRRDVDESVDAATGEPLLFGLDSMERAMESLVSEARAIFADFAVGNAEGAGRRMATMDRCFGKVMTASTALRSVIREIQRGLFGRQATEVEALKRYESLIAVAIILIITGIILYGTRLARRAEADDEMRRRVHDELVRAKQLAEAATAAKGAFLANMSHEIRTPLNAVIGMTGLLLETELDTTQEEYARMVRGGGESLLSIVNDVLDFSKIDAGKLELEEIEFDLSSMTWDVAELMAHAAETKGLELLVDVDPEMPLALLGDPSRLRQVLTNLIANAIKFTSAGSVHVRAQKLTEDANGASVRIEVVDTGIGIPVDRRDRLFESFSQVDASTTRQSGGTGLGLAICKRLVEAMGGRIGLDSEPERGSCFWLELPLRRGVGVAVRANPPILAGRRVLVVDDNATNRRILETQVRAFGMRVEQCAEGKTVLATLDDAIAAGDPFAIVVLDYMMPEVDGIDVARSIRARGDLRGLPILMLTSSALRSSLVGATSSLVDGYLTKPVRHTSLLDALMQVVDREVAAPRALVTEFNLPHRPS